MKHHPIRKLVWPVLAAILADANLNAALTDRQNWWATFDLGFGLLQRTIEEIETDDSTFYMGFGVGYAITPNFIAGIEFNGWSIQPSNELFYDPGDPPEGEAIAQYLLVTRLYPNRESSFYAKVGAGYASHWNQRWGEKNRGGPCFQLGAGYHLWAHKNFSITPNVSYSAGKLEDETYNAITMSIGFSWD